ncbi:helix-turn-helix transcriptional regulator [Lichenifustis flavocetrariae]|uniref:Helix-turn-helix transcriptional regulator n=1 Tax=Lichenifustis flavocetrariae TaxID=2949735 RepID=A0AA41YVP2_9HYPH|nr:helix-turn-helix transcriptional regulator [Lichenifustis flavocetrariae]MCW6507798.1 helix-turn-helix transcriptional regulator [Lichenifustis flavocetrariae]
MPEWDALTIDRTASAALGQAAAAIGREPFYRLLLAAVGCFIPHDLSAVMRYSAFSKPDLLLGTDYGPDFTGSYARDLYRYDPFYRYWRDVARPGVVSLADVVATEADRRHYVGAILHDVSISDEIGIFLPPIGQSSVALFLDRRAGSYTELDLARARLIYDLVAGLHAAHVEVVFGDGQIARGNAGALLAGPKPTRVLDRERHEIARNVGWSTCEAQHETILAEALAELADVGDVRIGCTLVLHRTVLPATFHLAPSGIVETIESFGLPPVSPSELAIPDSMSRLLSRREQDIVGLMLRGYPTKTIAERLGLTQGTVKNYRRRIYDKLDVTTEREVFLSCMAERELVEQ